MFIIVGEVLMDLVIADDKGKEIKVHIGGGPFNTALALSKLTQKVHYLYPISNDYYGRRISKKIKSNNISYICPYTSSFSTPLAVTHLNNNGKAEYRFYRHQTAERDLRLDELLNALPDKIELIHTGTLAIAEKPDSEIVEKLLIEARKKGAIISVDPNIRERNFEDKPSYRKNVLKLLAVADIIKLSDDDISFLYPHLKPEDCFNQVISDFSNASLIVMTQGKKNMLASYNHQIIHHSPYYSKEIKGDTIGAGDCFIAGLLYQCKKLGYLSPERIKNMSEKTVENILAFADKVAGLNCQTNGCNPPNLKDVQNIK